MAANLKEINHSTDDLWDPIIDYLPKGYSLSKKGVFLEKDNVLICGPCWVTALTRSDQGDDWGLVIHWVDQDGNHRHEAFPMNRIQETRSAIATDLASLGLKVIPGKHSILKEYLGGFNLPMDHRLQSVSKLGWLFRDNGSMAYVFPDDVVSITKTEEIIFQPDQHSPTTNSMLEHGNLESWLEYVAKPSCDNDLLLFGLCTSFAAPLLAFAECEGGGFHLYGSSSKGKTTFLQVAASVWGNGSDPGASDNSQVTRWHTTSTALEITAQAHNDNLLALDELGVCTADIGKVVYDLSGGLGKARGNKGITLRKPLTWRILILSTGEISVAEKIRELGQRMMDGQGVRMVDIHIGDGIAVNTKNQKPDEFANSLKRYAGQHYGVAGREFIKKLLEFKPNHFSLKEYTRNQLEKWKGNLSVNRVLISIQQRVIQRFAVLGVAGELAIKFGLLPITDDVLKKSLMSVLDQWLGDESNLPPVIRGINEIKKFYVANCDYRFKNLSAKEIRYRISNIAGYIFYHNSEKLVLFTPDGLNEACNGYEVQAVLKELKIRGYLKHEGGKYMKKFTLPGVEGRPSLYAIKLSFLDDMFSK